MLMSDQCEPAQRIFREQLAMHLEDEERSLVQNIRRLLSLANAIAATQQPEQSSARYTVHQLHAHIYAVTVMRLFRRGHFQLFAKTLQQAAYYARERKLHGVAFQLATYVRLGFWRAILMPSSYRQCRTVHLRTRAR